ncbi:MAG: hypothetical protein HY934_09630 [Candidatus Firestonebacteria bacterium]|nr:hypothetical protein [Candidatus Firestonebacteria bacterium]
MKKSTFLFTFLFIFLTINHAFPQNNKIVTYDPKILNIPYSSWITPLSYYKTAMVQKQIDSFIRIDKGELHGVKNGFIYDILDLKNNHLGKIVISVIADNFSEGYFITPVVQVEEKNIAVFDGTIDLEENPSYATFAEPEITCTITLAERDICYATLPEKSNISRGHQFIIKDESKEEAGITEVFDVLAKGNAIFKVIKQTKPIKEGFILVSKPRNISAWKNLAIELSQNASSQENALYAFYKAYDLDKMNPSIKQGFAETAQLLAKTYIKNNNNYKALRVYRQCQTITGSCKDEVIRLSATVKNTAYIFWEEKNLLMVIKHMELLEQDAEIQNKLATSYNNIAAMYSYEENPRFQIYLYQRAFEIDPKNTFIAKNLYNLLIHSKDYKSASEHLKNMQKNTPDEENKEWIEKNIEDVKRLESGLLHNYLFKGINNKDVNLASLKNNIVLLVKWSMNDLNSVQSLDFLPSFYNQFKGKPFKLLAVNIDPRNRHHVNALRSFMSKYEYDYDVVFSEEDLKDLFKFKDFPEYVLLDNDGKILYQESGSIPDKLEKLIQQLVK